MKKHFFTLLTSLFLLLFVWGSGQAATTFNNLVVFGDSLSDTGNVGRYSDGTIWVEALADQLGLALYDYAYAGATTGTYNLAGEDNSKFSGTGLLWQVEKYGSSSPIENSLVTVWAGANDLVNYRCYIDAVDNIVTALGLLYEEGFRYFMVPNLPDIGNTPKVQNIEEDYVQAASLWSQEFNNYLAVMLTEFVETNEGVVIYDLDIYSLFDEYSGDAQGWEDLFWTDGYHPSSTAHNLIASVAASVTASATPVPTTGFLLISGLLGLALAGRKRQNTAGSVS